MKISNLIFLVIVISLFLSCEKSIDPDSTVFYIKISEIGVNEAKFVGFYKDTNQVIISCGVCWGIEKNPTISNNKTVVAFQYDTIKCLINGLVENTDYHIKGFIETSQGVIYSNEIPIKTLSKTTLPEVVTSDIIFIQHALAKGGGNVTSDGGSPILSRGLCWSNLPNPTIIDTLQGVYKPKFYNVAGRGTGTFVGNIICLSPQTKYYIRAYATSNHGTSYGNEIEITTKAIEYGIVEDVEGNKYKTIQIDSQTWMAENLKTTKLNDNTPINNVIDSREWENLNAPAYCWYNHDISNKNSYGALYVWYTVNTNKICPSGWRVSSKSDWDLLVSNLGDSTYAGIKLKESGLEHWKNAKVAFDNGSGFTALPGGHRYRYGLFDLLGSKANFWLSDNANNNEAWYKDMNENGGEVGTWTQYKNVGYSVRCIKE